ncbi:RNA polymerase subunit sigma-70 [Nocardia spumae]|uniref:RNA polymerase subunit sigma-70 n=1 Tax=Nocardia spumae TaxID=2887190 RepID=UPI001D13DD44|nr:RNA polymerase subunit sigma-70 [Nocardia spumae]
MTSTPGAMELEALRIPLTGYCYRMLGGSSETEDAVQETLLRAFRRLDTFDPARARLTTWAHRIAHNVCVDLLRASGRRASPMDISELGEPGEFGEPAAPGTYVEPMPGSRLTTATDPAQRIVERESIRLAFVAALQLLTPPQRAALILRDVLSFSAAETAEIMDSSAAAVDSALHRARATLAGHGPAPTSEAIAHELAERYVRAFETHDVDALVAVLHTDVTTSMPPVRWWMRGAATVASLVAASDACAADRLLVTDINGQLGFGQYRPDDTGVLKPFALVALEFRDERIGHTTTFLGTAERFAEFGLPTRL